MRRAVKSACSRARLRHAITVPTSTNGAANVRGRARAGRQLERGGALLAVLWLSAGLAAIAFAIATTVRAETERTSTAVDGTRAHLLASGSIDRTLLWMDWGAMTGPNPDGTPRYYQPPMPFLVFDYPEGRVFVEIIPEAGKLNVNSASPEQLANVMAAAGADPDRARQIAAAILDWRSAGPVPQILPLGFGVPSSFPPRHASFQELEEILLVPGMTPELFYGHFDRDASGRLIPRGGVRDSLTVFGAGDRVDVNTAPPALLLSLGIPPAAVSRIVEMRGVRPFRDLNDVMPLVQGAPGADRLGTGGKTIWTLRATARLKLPGGALGDLRRSVAAVIKMMDRTEADPPYHILRWYDDAWSPARTPF